MYLSLSLFNDISILISSPQNEYSIAKQLVMEDGLDHKTLLQLQEDVARGSARRCNEALGCKLRRSATATELDSKLIPSTSKATNLLGVLVTKFLEHNDCTTTLRAAGGGDVEDVLSIEQTLQALLMIDSSYSTPWRALCEFASSCHGLPVFSLIPCVTLIEEFLHQKSTTQTPQSSYVQIPSTERPREFPSNSPGAMVLQFAKTLTDQYLMVREVNFGDSIDDNEVDSTGIDDVSSTSNEEFFFPLLMDLLYTTVRTCKDWNNDFFDEKIFATVHLRTPSPSRSIAWLRMAYDLRRVLSGDQLRSFGQVFLSRLWKKSVYLDDPSSLLRMVVDLANHSTSLLPDEAECRHAKLWRTITLVAFYQCCVGNMDRYSTIEACLSRNLTRWDITTLKNWIAEIRDECNHSFDSRNGDNVPSWFVWNGLIVCLGVLKNGHSWNCVLPGSLSDQTLGNSIEGDQRGGKDSLSPHHTVVLESAFGNYQECDEMLFDRLDQVQYKSGLFINSDGNEVRPLSSCGYGVLQSLFLGGSILESSPKMNANVVSRAFRMVSLADDLVVNCCEAQWQKIAIFANTVKTVAYFEIIGFRTVLVNKMRDDFRKYSSVHRLTRCHLSVLRLIFASNGNNADKNYLLEPLCDLLDEDMKATIFFNLIHTMASLSKARKKILDCAKRMIIPCFTDHFGRDNESTHYRQSLRSGILGLLELIRREDWTATEVGAWTTLSNIIVLNLPPVSSTNRRWLYATIESFVVDRTLPMKMAERLVRALAIRFGLFMNGDNRTFLISRAFRTSKQLVRSQTSHGVQNEDLLSLHRLFSIALRTLASAGKDFERRSVLLAQGREAFLRSILLVRGGEAPQHHLIESFFDGGLRCDDEEPDTFALCWFLFLRVNFDLLAHLCCRSERSHGEQKLGSSSMFTLVYLIESIQTVEREGLRATLGGLLDAEPSWLSSWSPKLLPNSELENMAAGILPRTKALVCDLLIELLFIAPFPACGSDRFVDPLCWKIIAGIGILIRQKQMLSKDGPKSGASNDCVASFSTETIFQTAESFFSVSSMVIRDAIHRDCTLTVFEELILSVLEYCDALNLAAQRFEERDCSALVVCLWDLYQSVASESASLKIIQYMESHLSENAGDGFLAPDGSNFSLAMMQNEKDVDDAMQKIRLRCLLPIQSCFSHGAAEGRNGERKVHTGSIDFFGGILAALARDLQVGLLGRSGGITPELFLAYCGSIEECSTLIFDSGMTSSIDLTVVSLFAQVATTFTGILVQYPFRDAVLFRTTYILASAILPSMCRDLLRRGLCRCQDQFNDVNNLFGHDSALLHRSFDDSVQILAKWAGLREPMLVPWSDIAGPEHAETQDMDVGGGQATNMTVISSLVSSNESRTSRCDIPRVVHVPSPQRIKRKLEPFQGVERIRLYTKEVWSWTLSCSLLALEQKWLESQRIIFTNHSPLDQEHMRQSTNWSSFYRAQKGELQNSLAIARKFLKASSDSSQLDEWGNQVILDVLASNLPSAPRLRLCCAIECIFRVLTHAIAHVYSCLVNGRENSTAAALNSLSFLEALCCLSSWLSTPATVDGDLSTGVSKWLAIVSRNSSPEEPNVKRSDGVGLVLRVSRLSKLAHELHSKLLLLQSYLQANVIKPIERELIFILNIFFDGGSTTMDHKILDLVSSRLRFIQTVIPGEFKSRHLPDFPVNEDTDRETREVDRKRNRSKTRFKKIKSSKRRTPDNRNKIVSMFMDLDQKIESGERRSTADAYADLEDFLVEG